MRLLILLLLFGSATSWAQLLQIEVTDAQTNARLEESFAVLKGSAPIKSNNGIITIPQRAFPLNSSSRLRFIFLIPFRLAKRKPPR